MWQQRLVAVYLDVVEDERLAGAGALRQPHDGAELDVPVDLGVDFGELALRLERFDKAAQIAEGDRFSFGGDILGAGLEHDDTESDSPTHMLSSPRKRGPKTTASGIWVPACAGTTGNLVPNQSAYDAIHCAI